MKLHASLLIGVALAHRHHAPPHHHAKDDFLSRLRKVTSPAMIWTSKSMEFTVMEESNVVEIGRVLHDLEETLEKRQVEAKAPPYLIIYSLDESVTTDTFVHGKDKFETMPEMMKKGSTQMYPHCMLSNDKPTASEWANIFESLETELDDASSAQLVVISDDETAPQKSNANVKYLEKAVADKSFDEIVQVMGNARVLVLEASLTTPLDGGWMEQCHRLLGSTEHDVVVLMAVTNPLGDAVHGLLPCDKKSCGMTHGMNHTAASNAMERVASNAMEPMPPKAMRHMKHMPKAMKHVASDTMRYMASHTMQNDTASDATAGEEVSARDAAMSVGDEVMSVGVSVDEAVSVGDEVSTDDEVSGSATTEEEDEVTLSTSGSSESDGTDNGLFDKQVNDLGKSGILDNLAGVAEEPVSADPFGVFPGAGSVRRLQAVDNAEPPIVLRIKPAQLSMIIFLLTFGVAVLVAVLCLHQITTPGLYLEKTPPVNKEF